MWIVGLVVGLVIGASIGSFEWALVLGLAGALGSGPLVRRLNPGPSAGSASAADRESGADPIGLLHRRIDALNTRVVELERAALAGGRIEATPLLQRSAAAAPPVSAPPTDRAAMVERPDTPAPDGERSGVTPDAVPGAGFAAATPAPGDRMSPVEPVIAERPLTRAVEHIDPTLTIAASLPATIDSSPVPRLAPEPLPVPAPAASASAVGTPPAASPPPPPPPSPPRPWPERLPAPLRRLIFGGNALVKAGVLILFLGLAFLLSYTAERVTVPLELRYALVALAGAGLLGLGWFLRNRRRDYALVLQGAGIGVFYLTTLAAMKLSELLPPSIGFGFLFAVAVLSALLAVLQNAPVLAIVAALEGFAAPVLASTGQSRPLALLSYLLVLDIGIFLIAWFKAWRPLNLIGLAGTFTLAAGAARASYTADQYAVYQPFLVVFFLLFAIIGLLFARRTLADAPALAAEAPLAERALATWRRVGRVDSSLVFGAPMAAFGLQYVLVRDTAFGPAFSAIAFGAFYLALGRQVFKKMPPGLALLAEAYAVVGVIFATLAIPLGFEGRWTGAAWAVEAAGMYWLGIRQQRVYSRAFAFLLVVGAVVQLLRDIAVVDADGMPWLQGSLIGPILLAAGVFAIWLLQRRHRLDRDSPHRGLRWEAPAGAALPWIGMTALALLPWQTLPPSAAAAATGLLSVATYAAALRFGLAPLRATVHGLQVLAVLAFIATLQAARQSHGGAIDGGRYGTLNALLIVLSVLATAGWSMRLAHRAGLASGTAPRWSRSQVVGTLAGVGLLHAALLLALDWRQVAAIWPWTALAVLWVALRLAHRPLAALAALLHSAAVAVFAWQFLADDVVGRANLGPAYANLGFWTPLALGITALVAADWCRGEAVRCTGGAEAALARRRWLNGWCTWPAVRWLPPAFGLFWWMAALLGESRRVLLLTADPQNITAASVGWVLATSVLASALAARRGWRELRLLTLATLPGLVLVGIAAWSDAATLDPVDGYRPSSHFGWLAWPLALAWHLRLLRGQDRHLQSAALAPWHMAGLWFFLLLAARECHVHFLRLGDDRSAWPMLGWVLVPALLLWALPTPAFLRRWPLARHRQACIDLALTPVAVLLLGWCWVSNLISAGDAAPLPYLPLLNPLELGQALVLMAVGLWWRALSPGALLRISPTAASRAAAVTGWALLTGIVLRSCHHFLGVPWEAPALYTSWPTQAALSLTWAACGVAAMVLGHARAARPVWLAGAVLIGIVVVKLFLVEFADRGGLFRIVSFIGVGALLLLVGYFAPVPPGRGLPKEVSA